MTGQQTVDLLERVWADLDTLYGALTDDEWAAPTECPGWTVQDLLSHVCGTESHLLGNPMPDHVVQHAPHVRNPVGAMNEVEVDVRRPLPGARVLEEFRELTSARLRTLRATSDEEFTAEVMGPIGVMTLQGFMALRAFDCWLHDQDARRATGRRGGWDSPGAPFTVDRLASGMARVVGKNAPEGAIVAFELEGPEVRRRFALGVTGGRGGPVDPDTAGPTARLVMDTPTFVALAAGRADPATERSEGRVRVEGDEEVAGHVLGAMSIVI